ncbi:saccharopine dehydrogenase NADP-binding domain-containing protein [Ihubacter massiliensis]|uniref:Saccharopine dehydrogenase NADP-binding domain-containing protein n=1 Tax=Hominibacterium faecale TaxID=2839743 RepID=A0A9J6QY74_9FIRM|nr:MULTISPECIES: saccharopine dehydrogenase NADP-binding domain-containing protein [Eubacteriales Family XIII. Incertae Sedis]MCC2864350.1 saccharopine dehydrogenase NADP-binding domain-containing protein [Anaerovorax odorimutans]MCI7300500.1 saccharopine dehydrogenase NADP-binding domain-containing protein [Clostridia bacterium]MDY3010756.1 saccharopine dehydrogenase NADP-binding domain-containing protein [Clostridiales Family XIII bacterium]MCO7120361.1 saccharopine dehydrogenase NADP-binding
MGKKILVLGTGAQGSTVAQRMDEEPNVEKIICADADHKAVDELVKILKKAEGTYVDANEVDSIIKAAQDADLIINALPIKFAPKVLEAALAVKANYQDFAATDVLDPWWPKCVEILYNDYGKRFRKLGKLAVIGTGSAPGMMCVAAKNSMRYLDTCEDILMMVYEGVEAKRFLPFWWSPFTALSDMTDPTFALKDGVLVETEPHSLPVTRLFKGCAKEVTLVEHAHDETVYMGLNKDTHFKGAKNINFKYGGVGIDFSTPLYRAGLLEREEQTYKGHTFIPFDVILSHLPPAPKYYNEIKEILDEGLVKDEGAFVVECTGTKDGKKIMVETYLYAPGCEESFKRAGITGEQYLTGQCGALFTKMFVNDDYNQTGLLSSDMLTYEECDKYLAYANELDIILETEVKPYLK